MVIHPQANSEQGVHWLFAKLQLHWQRLRKWFISNKKILSIVILLLVITYISLKPQQFVDLWLTPDQQGSILFNMQKYQMAGEHFADSRWQAYSYYGAEQFDTAANLYSQFNEPQDLLARGNAYAHGRRYVRARGVYQAILEQYPDYQAAQTNLDIVQGIIDEVNRISESQQQEDSDAPKELGDDPQTAEGAERKVSAKQLEQYSAEDILQDPELADMWMRQVQKDPARFLAIKFAVQLQQGSGTSGKVAAPPKKEESNKEETNKEKNND
ncbi:tetratricopeptide repeat protein [Thalassotalea sp. PS06]|uniref:tetratricopeptide repeat protein n=1 Tax=Thalassotalea sp. PS06 TaxID=2594005 RepID=UPI00116313EB|nr:tetratricopeptide repeat protein [Thalassotalea sp. PS06]QDP01144.1 tetratricopeptide repeat protein [Thalassotalea sp. PS06]